MSKRISKDDLSIWQTTIKDVVPLKQPNKFQPTYRKNIRVTSYKISFVHDLHGYTIDHAYDYLKDLITDAHSSGLKSLRVITGKSGQLLKEVPKWLEANRLVRSISLEKSGGSYLVKLDI